MVKRESGTGRQSDSVNEKLSWKEGRDGGGWRDEERIREKVVFSKSRGYTISISPPA